MKKESVNHPNHYTWLPNGLEVIDIVENLNFNMGNSIKYVLRADHKRKPIEDLRKALWYITRELKRRGYHERDTSIRQSKKRSTKTRRPISKSRGITKRKAI
jgi:hypothetical protein